MIYQGKDRFYDEFLHDPTKENFRVFLQNNCGELDETDFKQSWINKGHLAKTVLAMANSRGGVIVVGVQENEDGTLLPIGINEFKDKAVINDEIAKFVSPGVDYEILDYSYQSSDYEAVQGKKFQILLVYDTPGRLPFVSRGCSDGIEKDVIYVRRGTKCEKATAEEIDQIIEYKISTIFKDSSDLTLEQHLEQLKALYRELPPKINVLVRKGPPPAYLHAIQSLAAVSKKLLGQRDEYEEQDNPNYPNESYEAFVLRVLKMKRVKIEKVLDLK